MHAGSSVTSRQVCNKLSRLSLSNGGICLRHAAHRSFRLVVVNQRDAHRSATAALFIVIENNVELAFICSRDIDERNAQAENP